MYSYLYTFATILSIYLITYKSCNIEDCTLLENFTDDAIALLYVTISLDLTKLYVT